MGGSLPAFDLITLAVAAVGAAIAVGTLLVAVLEYVRQGRQKRAEHFLSLRLRLKESKEFSEIAALLDNSLAANPDLVANAAERLAQLPFPLKRDYLGLFEEVALALNSGLIRRKVAHYMFGYYAILCWENGAFWANVNKFSPYWSLFARFYEEMKSEQEKFAFRQKEFHF